MCGSPTSACLLFLSYFAAEQRHQQEDQRGECRRYHDQRRQRLVEQMLVEERADRVVKAVSPG